MFFTTPLFVVIRHCLCVVFDPLVETTALIDDLTNQDGEAATEHSNLKELNFPVCFCSCEVH